MADLNQGYNDIQNKINGLKTFKEVKSSIKDLSSKADNSNELANKNIANTLSSIEDQKNRLQKEVQSQFQQLIKLISLNRGNGLDTTKFLKQTFVKSIKKVKPEIEQITIEEIVKLLGCSQQQTYSGDQTIYIRVKNVDFKELLKISPDTNVGKAKYEKDSNLDSTGIKYPMNRQLFQRITEEGITYTFKGASNQDLFDISYEQSDNIGQPGDFFKVTLYDRDTGPNKIVEFLQDYYQRMSFVEFNSITSELMDALTGSISAELNLGVNQIKDQSKFGRIISRVLGLCFDNRNQIDVSGTAKTGELDNLDDDFFEFTEVDLLNIDQEVYNVQNKAVEFEDCGNIKFPVNSFDIVNSINQLNFINENNDEELINGINQVTNTFTQNNGAGTGFQLNPSFQLSFDFSFINKLPLSLINSILSPKIFLPIFIMFKAGTQTVQDIEINSLMDFAKKYKSFFVNLSSKIGGLFVKELFRIIKKDIINLIKGISSDLSKEASTKKYAIILNLVALLIQVIKIIQDWRQCKNILDQILALLKLPGIGRNIVPAPLLLATPLLPGYSAERSFINTINELQKLGLPTGPLPDGSPNLGLVAQYSMLKGQGKELWENGKTEMFIPPIPVIAGTATSPKSLSGKFV